MKKVIDHTMYSSLKNCPRLFYYSFLLNLSHKEITSRLPAEFGIALHLALEELYSNPSKSKEAVYHKFIDHWSKFDGLCPNELRTMTKGLLILQKYMDSYGFPSLDEIVKTEASHSFLLDNGWTYSGKIDRIVFDGEDKKFVSPVDNKSSSVRNMICTNPNAQIVGYAFLLLEEQYEVRTASFDFLYFRKGKKNEDQYETVSLEREEISITDEIISEWILDLNSYIIQLERFLEEDYFPKNTNSCKDYGLCPFLFLCEIGTDYRKIKEEVDLDHLYSRKVWNPLKGKEE